MLALANLPQLKKTLKDKCTPRETHKEPELRPNTTAQWQLTEPPLWPHNRDGACGRQIPADEDTSSTHRKRQPGPRSLQRWADRAVDFPWAGQRGPGRVCVALGRLPVSNTGRFHPRSWTGKGEEQDHQP